MKSMVVFLDGNDTATGAGMEENFIKNASVHICSRTHLNITFNIYHCGNYDVEAGQRFTTAETDVFTMFSVNSGSCRLETESYTGDVSEKNGIVIFPGTSYKLLCPGPEKMNLTWVVFSGYRVEDYLGRAAIWPSRPVFEDPKERFGEKLNRLYMLSHEPFNRYCKMASVLYDIFAYLRDVRAVNPTVGYKDYFNYYAARAVNFIERNYSKPIYVENIADSLGITRKHLCTIFRKVLNVTPRQYIIYYRLEKACKMLRGSSLSIQEVAEAVGYSNQFYFAKEFKRVLNMSPSEYRKSEKDTEVFTFHSFVTTLMKEYKFGSADEEGDWSIKITGPNRKQPD